MYSAATEYNGGDDEQDDDLGGFYALSDSWSEVRTEDLSETDEKDYIVSSEPADYENGLPEREGGKMSPSDGDSSESDGDENPVDVAQWLSSHLANFRGCRMYRPPRADYAAAKHLTLNALTEIGQDAFPDVLKNDRMLEIAQELDTRAW